MPSVQISLVGQSYQSRSVPLSAQVTRNFYPEPVPNGVSVSALLSWPGAKLFSAGVGAGRGIKDWGGAVYSVNGTTLYKSDSLGVRTNLGSIAGSDRCVMTGSASYLYIVTGGKVYRTDGLTVETVTDEDLEAPSSAAFLNSLIIYDGDGGRFAVSDPGDGGSVSSLNYATAEAVPDDLLRVYVFNSLVYMLGTKSGEPWYNSGVGNPPLDRVDGGIFHIGLAGVHAVTHTDKAMYFLGHDRTIYRLEGYSPVQKSTIAINNAIESYRDVSDCFAFALKLQGQSIVVFSFPSANKTWAYSETFNQWFELSTGVTGGRHLANGYCYEFGKHLIIDYRNGNIYEWDLATYTDNDETIIRERVTQPINSDVISQPGKEIFWNELELVLNSGNGLILGQGSNPQVMMQFSDDMGLNWSNELWASAGHQGAYQYKCRWTQLGSSIGRIFRFRASDPIEMHFYKLFADIEVGI